MGVLRKTKNLERVLAAFADEGRALTAKAVLDLMPSGVNKTTVYRLLERLKDDGVLHSFTSGDGLVHYAKSHACPNSAHVHSHPHFQCESCHEITCLEGEFPLPEWQGIRISEAQIFLKGQCMNCLSA